MGYLRKDMVIDALKEDMEDTKSAMNAIRKGN